MKKLISFFVRRILIWVILLSITLYEYTLIVNLKNEIKDIRNQSKYIYKNLSGGIKTLKPATGELRERQLNLISVLKEFERIANKHNIEYYADFGTLLGAVRHEGFIPWDDDIDLAMTEDNIEKLIELSKKSNAEFTIRRPDEGKILGLYFLDTKFGSVDIFPYICISDENLKKASKYSNFSELTQIFRKDFRQDSMQNLLNLKKDFKTCQKDDWVVIISHQHGTKPGFAANSIDKCKIKYGDLYPLKKVKFENIKLPAPNKPEKLLEGEYTKGWNDLPTKFGYSHHIGQYI